MILLFLFQLLLDFTFGFKSLSSVTKMHPTRTHVFSFQNHQALKSKTLLLEHLLSHRGRSNELNDDMKEDDNELLSYQDLNDVINPQYSLPSNSNGIDELPVHQGLVQVDAFCPYHGRYLSNMAKLAYNAGIVNVVSDYVFHCLIDNENEYEAQEQEELELYLNAKIPKKESIKEWLEQIPFEIVGIICESDSGLDEAERFGVNLGLYPKRHDGYNNARRDKYLMNEVVGSRQLRVAKQKLCSSLEEATSFAVNELGVAPNNDEISTIPSTLDENVEEISIHNTNSYQEDGSYNSGLLGKATNLPSSSLNHKKKYCVVKPCRGVASDDVYFCSDIKSIEESFSKIHLTPTFGSTQKNELQESVLIQEFIAGTEYAIDIVSKNGEHKVAALWRYDKRSVNGAPFVYFGTEVIDALHNPSGEKVCTYAKKALDALDIKWGLTHIEIILENELEKNESIGRPCLVEVNCRQHNTDFVPLTSISIGYNPLDMLLSAYLGDGDKSSFPQETEHLRLDWDDLPPLPVTRAFAAIVHLVSYVEGTITDVNIDALQEIESLPSVLAMEVYDHFNVGNRIKKTKDIRSDSGWVHILNEDKEQFIADYNRIVELMPVMFGVK